MSEDGPLTQDAFLRRKAREAIQAKTLPARSPDRIWGGIGSGTRCCICGLSIEQEQTELELEFVLEDLSKSRYHIVHLRCFSVFEVERQVLLPKELSTNVRAHSAAATGGPDHSEAT